ncbi:MAG: CBS domain-containing protein [Deltaproteobacteria bacterium]|nr:CBS domain-containing protein [Deltaproteobacteria bacterium]
MENLTAKEIMNPEVLTVNTELSIQGLADFFFQNAISGAPVISDDGKLIGAVSITDILRHETVPEKGVQFNHHHDFYVHTTDDRFSHQDLDALHFTDEVPVTVGDIMTSRILVVGENDMVQQVADIMIKNRIHRVFVTRDERPIGIISTADMLKVIRDM